MLLKKITYFTIIIIVIFFNSPFHIANIFFRLNNLSNIPSIKINYDHKIIEPNKIKDIVNKIIPYSHDFNVYHVSCYIPDINDILNHKIGDCKARTILYSAILKGSNINNKIMYSMVHWWVDFKNRSSDNWEKKYENNNDALWSQNKGLNLKKINRNIKIIFENLMLYRKMMFDDMSFYKKIFFIITLFLLIINKNRYFKNYLG